MSFSIHTLLADQLSQEWSEELSTKLRDVEEAHLQEMVAAINELKGVQSIIGTVVETGVNLHLNHYTFLSSADRATSWHIRVFVHALNQSLQTS